MEEREERTRQRFPDASDVREARKRIAPYIRRTPLVFSHPLSEISGAELRIAGSSQDDAEAEGAAATGPGALLSGAVSIPEGSKAAVVITGNNVDPDAFLNAVESVRDE